MKKELSDLTLEELWELFPIVIEPHKQDYFKWFAEEKSNIENVIQKDAIYRVSHIGSSAVKGLLSKNTVDILVECYHLDHLKNAANQLSLNGYIIMSKRLGDNPQISLNKGYTINGYAERVFHLHMRLKGDWPELYFRDYLIDHTTVAKEYENLKIDLSMRYKHNREAYTNEKTSFIKKYSDIAMADYQNKYKPSE